MSGYCSCLLGPPVGRSESCLCVAQDDGASEGGVQGWRPFASAPQSRQTHRRRDSQCTSDIRTGPTSGSLPDDAGRALWNSTPSNRSTFPQITQALPLGMRAAARGRGTLPGPRGTKNLRVFARARMTRGCSAARAMVVFRRARSGAVLLRALARRCSSAPSMTPPSVPNYVLHGDWRANEPMSTLHQRGRDGRSLAAVA